MIEIIEAEADDLAGPRHRQREFQSGERTARGGRRLLGEIGERFEVAIVPAQGFAEIGRHAGVHRLQIDDRVALDHAEPHAIIRFKTDDLHESLPCHLRVAQGLAQADGLRKMAQALGAGPSASVKAWIEK